VKVDCVKIIYYENPAADHKGNTDKGGRERKEFVHKNRWVKAVWHCDHYSHLLFAVMIKAIPVRPPRPKDIMSDSCRVIASRMVVRSAGVISVIQKVRCSEKTGID
jgi:hypothetical protein